MYPSLNPRLSTIVTTTTSGVPAGGRPGEPENILENRKKTATTPNVRSEIACNRLRRIIRCDDRAGANLEAYGGGWDNFLEGGIAKCILNCVLKCVPQLTEREIVASKE